MPFIVKNFSVVIVGKNHNPTLLNPDFLKINGIVSNDKKVTEAITTPPLSVVKFEDEISITMELEKLQISQPSGDRFQDSYEIIDCARQFLNTLPHVTYTAVGLNWSGVCVMDNPGDWIIHNLVNDGAWAKNPYEIKASSVKFTYEMPGQGVCNINFVQGEKEIPEGLERALVISANYHNDIDGSVDSAHKIIEGWPSLQSHFMEYLKTVVQGC